MTESDETIGAIFALKRKKMLEKEVAKLDGQMVLLEQQRLMIESKEMTNIHTLFSKCPGL